MVTVIDPAALLALPGVPGASTAAVWAEKCRWLVDDELYAAHGVPVRRSYELTAANYRPEWIERLLQTGVICPVDRRDVTGAVRLLAVAEKSRQRFRAIMHTVDINDYCGADTIDHCTFPTKQAIADAVHEGDWMVALDFSAYYYQFALSHDVGCRMCFRWNQRTYRLQRLAMGQRQAVDVANAATQRLLDFEHESARVMSIIDNVLFVGTREAVINDAWAFVQRCRDVNATLNELDVRAATRDSVAELATQEGDWGGVHLDLANKAVSLTQKVLDKARLSWGNRERWQWRHYAAHIGLLFWPWGIIDLPMASFFDVLRFNSEVGKVAMSRLEQARRELGLPEDAMPANPFWSEPAAVWKSVEPALARWTEMVLQNAPRAVMQRRDTEVLLECDASKWGWCCYGLHLPTDDAFTCSEAWTDEMRRRFGDKLGESTLAEPFGVLYSLIRARERFPGATRFAVTNDNTVAVVSHSRGFNSRSWAINECLRQREAAFPTAQYSITMQHTAGATNIADGGSRGFATGEVDGAAKAVLRSRWGTTDGATAAQALRGPSAARVAAPTAPPIVRV